MESETGAILAHALHWLILSTAALIIPFKAINTFLTDQKGVYTGCREP